MVYTVDPKGPLFKNMGKVFPSKDDPLGSREGHSNRLWLLPEEILYLLERGTVDVRWPAEGDEDDDVGVPMSLQGAYAAFIGREDEVGGALTFERYSVYAGLKRMGYVVHRAPSWDGPGDVPGEDCLPPLQASTWSLGLLGAGWRKLFGYRTSASYEEQKEGPLVQHDVYRNYGMSLNVKCIPHHCANDHSRHLSSSSTSPWIRPCPETDDTIQADRSFF